MPQFSVRMEGSDRVRVGLNRYIDTLPIITKRLLRQLMTRAMKRSVPYLGGNRYSIPLRGYKRTGNLGRSTHLENSGLTYTIKSDAYTRTGRAYSRYVIGMADGSGQARVHWGWWTPMRSAIDLELENTLPEMEQELQRGVEAVGL